MVLWVAADMVVVGPAITDRLGESGKQRADGDDEHSERHQPHCEQAGRCVRERSMERRPRSAATTDSGLLDGERTVTVRASIRRHPPCLLETDPGLAGSQKSFS